MTRVSPAQVAFSAGEISPLLHRRFDYQRHQTGMAMCRGFIPLRQGGFTRAPGTIHRGTTRNNLPARLVDFEFAANDAVTLEFTHMKMRVWRYGALVMVGPAPFELTTPFPETSLPSLQWVQSADVIYITDGLRQIQKLSRFALDNWTIAAAEISGGPFRVQNLDTALTVQASAATGSVTLTASAALFAANHIGSLMRLKPQDNASIPLWSGNTTVTVGQLMRYDGRTYKLTAGTNTGVNPPQHHEGIEQVSLSPDVKWEHMDDGEGIVRIMAVASGTSATAVVLKRLPAAVVSGPTYRWEEGAWSDRYGYPSVIELYDQRLVAAATPSEPRTVWFSAIGDYQDFTPSQDADGAFAYAIAGRSSVNRITWLCEGRTGLHVGALGEEYSARPGTQGQAIGPTNAVFGRDSSLGSLPGVRPVAPSGRPVFIAKDGRRIIEIGYALEQDANVPSELSLPADHLGADGFRELVYQSAPLRLTWVRRGNGELAVMQHDPAEQVLGWASYPLAGGHVESMAVTPDVTGQRDILTMVVRRTINGETVRLIEEQAPTYGIVADAMPIAEAIHYFAAKLFDLETASNTFSVPHLVGQAAHAWTSAGEFGPIMVGGDGQVTLPRAVTWAIIGLFDATHYAETLDLLGAAPDGSTMGRLRRITPAVRVGLHRSAAGQIASVERDFGEPERIGRRQNLIPRAVAAELTDAWTGVSRAEVTSGSAAELALRIFPVGGAPLTITAIVPPISEAGQ